MEAVDGRRRGWCPGFWTPMESGDGLLVRLHVGVGGVSSTQLRSVAELSRAHGNGQIEVTRRANIQLRGIRAGSLRTLQNELLGQGLGAPSPDAALGAALLVNPLAGLDAHCVGLAALQPALAGVLGAFERPRSLPGKLAIVLDVAGACAAFCQIRADVRIEVSVDARCRVSVGERVLGDCRREHAVEVVRRVLGVLADFNDAEGAANARMFDLLAADGGEVLRTIAADLPLDAHEHEHDAALSRGVPWLGWHEGARDWFGVGIPFGSADSAQWLALAGLADRFAASSLRVAPSRCVMLVDVAVTDAERLAAAARECGLLVDASDPLTRVVACPGAPACSSAQGQTRALARELGALLGPEQSLHVSGCAKSCAASGPSDVTLVPAADGCKLGFDSAAAEVALAPTSSLGAARWQLTSRAHPPAASIGQ